MRRYASLQRDGKTFNAISHLAGLLRNGRIYDEMETAWPESSHSLRLWKTAGKKTYLYIILCIFPTKINSIVLTKSCRMDGRIHFHYNQKQNMYLSVCLQRQCDIEWVFRKYISMAWQFICLLACWSVVSTTQKRFHI